MKKAKRNPKKSFYNLKQLPYLTSPFSKSYKVLPKPECTKSQRVIAAEVPKGKLPDRFHQKSSVLSDEKKPTYSFSKEVLSPKLTNWTIPPTESVSRFGHKSFKSISHLRVD